MNQIDRRTIDESCWNYQIFVLLLLFRCVSRTVAAVKRVNPMKQFRRRYASMNDAALFVDMTEDAKFRSAVFAGKSRHELGKRGRSDAASEEGSIQNVARGPVRHENVHALSLRDVGESLLERGGLLDFAAGEGLHRSGGLKFGDGAGGDCDRALAGNVEGDGLVLEVMCGIGEDFICDSLSVVR